MSNPSESRRPELILPRRRLLLTGALAGLTAGCQAEGAAAGLADAPEIARPGLRWFNVANPVPLASLRGKVVVLDFWTEGCINCIHIVPTLRRVEQRFPDQVAVIGIHSPKFATEKEADSVADAIQRYGIRHPVEHDPEMAVWRDYQVRGWPTLVLIDAAGHIAGRIESEPEPDKFEQTIAALVDQAQRGGALRPVPLALTVSEPPPSRFRFPGKLKRLPGTPKQWVLADAGHHQVVLLDDKGTELRRFGAGTPGLRDGAANAAQFNEPQGLIADAAAIYVADTGNHAVRRIDRASSQVTTLAGTGQRGWSLHASGPARRTALGSPWDLELAGQHLFVAAAGTHQVLLLDLAANEVRPFAGTGAEGLVSGPASQATLAQPSGLAIGADGRTLYVADSEGSAVRAVTLGNAPAVSTLVGAGLFEFGAVNGPLDRARLQHPLGVAPYGDGLLVADTYNSALRVIDLARREVRDFDGGTFTCNDPLCLPAREPAGVVADGPDRVLMVDTGNHRIDEYQVAAKNLHTWAH